MHVARELSIPTKPGQAGEAIQRFDGFELVESDRHDAARDQALIMGQFLIDRDGIVRWINIEHEPGELLSDKRRVEARHSFKVATDQDRRSPRAGRHVPIEARQTGCEWRG